MSSKRRVRPPGICPIMPKSCWGRPAQSFSREHERYEAFVAALVAGEKMPFKEWEKETPYFEG